MFIASLIPALGFTGTAHDIRIQYTHTHEHEEHEHHHDQETGVADNNSDDGSKTHQHSHELVVSAVVLTFIASKSNLAFVSHQAAMSYPKIQDVILPLSHSLNSIFRPPIAA